MASSVNYNQKIHDLGVHDEEHPIWSSAFSDDTRLQQLNDDLAAGRSVSAVLVAIVTCGLLLAVVSVFVLV